MKKKTPRLLGVAGLLLMSAGCAGVGDLTGGVGPLLSLAFYAALMALPFVIAYYTWYRD